MSNGKKFIFSFIAVVLIPLIFFTIIELSLAIFGVGNSYDYFHEIEINGELHYQDNPQFADQFYPPSLSIAPLNNTFAEHRGTDALRVFILGGSAAQGFPHVNHGLNRHLTAQLQAAFPARKIEVINTAMTSVNSHVVYEVAKGIPNNSADFAVILMGNNEVVGPYGPSTFSQNFLPNLSMIRMIQALKRTRTWQAVATLIQQAQPVASKEDIVWQGMQMFTEFSVPHNDPRLEDVYSHYQNNLTDIIEILQDKGIHVLLSSVPVNLRHSAPFGSAHKEGLTEQQLQQWQVLEAEATSAFAEQNWAAAVTAFEAAIAIDSDYADSHFRLATAYENLNQNNKARAHYERALDLDTLRFRTNSQLNQIIKDVANSVDNDAFSFVDNAEAFDIASTPVSPGWNLLHEHVHFNFAGNYILSKELSRTIVSELTPNARYRSLSMTETAQWIGFPNHETIEVMKRLLGMVNQAPFTQQSNHETLKQVTQAELDQLTEQVGTPADVVARRKGIVESGNADWKIHFELAALNRHLRNQTAVKYHLNEIIRLYPHSHESYMNIAELMSKEGNLREANYFIEQSLFYSRGDRDKIAKAIGWLGMNYLRLDDYERGTDYLLDITNNYSDLIGPTFRAYGTLMKFAKDKGKTRDVNRLMGDVQRYAERLIEQGRDKEFRLFYRRMAQIMTLAGNSMAAQEWQARANTN